LRADQLQLRAHGLQVLAGLALGIEQRKPLDQREPCPADVDRQHRTLLRAGTADG